MSSEWGAEDAGVAGGPTVDVGSIEVDPGVNGDGCEPSVAGAVAPVGRVTIGIATAMPAIAATASPAPVAVRTLRRARRRRSSSRRHAHR